jgi:stress response protein SCP2
MRDVETIIRGVLDNSITVKELTVSELDATIDELVAIADSLLDTENHEVGIAMLEVLDQAIEIRGAELEPGFEEAIIAAEQRGSTYWEIENPSIH